jgi:HD-GYP domain-containing protein (c-di-GMP phosphodiesterase class II)
MDSLLDKNQVLAQYFEIRIASVTAEVPLAFDLFLYVAGRVVLFRRRGDVLTTDRMKLLHQHGGETFLVPNDQRDLYRKSLINIVHDPDSSSEMKGKFLKESAFLHINDLFTKKDVAHVVPEAQSLVEEMVTFVTADMEAVSSLMRLSRHDYYTYNHCVDVAVYSIVLARRIFGEDKDMLLAAGLGGLLHDIGKREIDWNVINKKGALTPTEWEEIKRHPTSGRECLEHVNCVPDLSRLVVYQHHENFDGTGYPQGLKEDQISNLARIVTIADVFDALTTDRSYHKAITPKEAMNSMFGMQPGKFDPTIFRSFNKNFSKHSKLELPPGFDACSPQAVLSLIKK